jgi:F0F1-type ATP synthase epsilon subunit
LLRIDHGESRQFFFVAGGFAEVLDNKITILTPDALTADKLNPKAIDDELAAAEKISTATEPDRQKRQKAFDMARGNRLTFNEASAKK